MAIRILFLTALFMTSSAMAAQSAERNTALNGKAALSDGELADMRGGFLTAGGAQFDFGASIKTMVNGQLALQTNLQWTDAGAVTRQLTGLGQSIRSQVNDVVASNLALAGVKSGIASPVGAPAPSDVTSNAGTSIAQEVSAAAGAAPVETAVATAAAADTASPMATASAPAVVTGMEVPGIGGTTQVFANLTPNQIQSIILNTASGQNITQNTDITFTIYNFQAWQQQLAERMVSARLASDMLAASGFAAGH